MGRLSVLWGVVMSWMDLNSSPPVPSNASPDPGFIHRMVILYVRRKGKVMSTASLMWVLPTTRTDGSALSPSEIQSVDIFDTDTTTPIANVPGAGTTFTTGTLSVGVHNFTVVVNDTTGHKSAPSNTASLTVPATLANPSPATSLTATLNP